MAAAEPAWPFSLLPTRGGSDSSAACPPYVYVHRIHAANLGAWKNLRACAPGEPPELIVRQPPTPQSVFRGLVRPEGMGACDVLQVWVDVASHPARGREQADVIRKRVLRRVIEGGRE